MWYTQTMQTLKGIGQFFFKWSVRLTKMAQHRFTSKRKNIMIFGESNSLLYQTMYKNLKNTYQITRIYTEQPPLEQTNSDQTEKTKEIQIRSKKSVKSFYQEHRLSQNYAQIEKTLEGRQFDSIVVLPKQNNKSFEYDFEDQNFALGFLQHHEKELMRNLFPYRLASKYLTTSGVLILSGSERDFLKAQSEDKLKDLQNYQKTRWYPSSELIDSQITFLGVVAGQRDDTDLNSWSLVAMSKEWLPQNVQFVSKHYCYWLAGRHLPMPGSFALFKRKNKNHSSPYLQYV